MTSQPTPRGAAVRGVYHRRITPHSVAQPPTAGRLLSGRAVSTAERVLLAGGAASSSAASAEAFLRTAAAQSLWMHVDAGDAGPSASPRSRATAGSPLTASPPHRPVRGPAPPTAVHLNGDGGQARRLGSSRSPGRPRRAASRRGGEEGSESTASAAGTCGLACECSFTAMPEGNSRGNSIRRLREGSSIGEGGCGKNLRNHPQPSPSLSSEGRREPV